MVLMTTKIETRHKSGSKNSNSGDVPQDICQGWEPTNFFHCLSQLASYEWEITIEIINFRGLFQNYTSFFTGLLFSSVLKYQIMKPIIAVQIGCHRNGKYIYIFKCILFCGKSVNM